MQLSCSEGNYSSECFKVFYAISIHLMFMVHSLHPHCLLLCYCKVLFHAFFSIGLKLIGGTVSTDCIAGFAYRCGRFSCTVTDDWHGLSPLVLFRSSFVAYVDDKKHNSKK